MTMIDGLYKELMKNNKEDERSKLAMEEIKKIMNSKKKQSPSQKPGNKKLSTPK